LVRIRINVKKKENFSIIEKGTTVNVSIIEKIFQRENCKPAKWILINKMM